MSAAGVIAASYLALLGLKAGCAAWAIRTQRALRVETPDAGIDATPDLLRDVTILQPILSGDPRLERLLERNLRGLAEATFVWLVDADDADGRQIVERIATRVAADHPDPDRSARLVVVECDAAPDGVNPKTFKLDRAFARVTTRYCMVLDDDAVIDAPAVARLVAALEAADLSTALPFYADAEQLPGRVLAQFVNNNAALTYLSTLVFLPPLSINGMCYVARTKTLAKLGGFAPLLAELADDLALATAFRTAGLRIAQTIAPVEVSTTVASWARYRRQMHRWFLFATLLFAAEGTGVRLLGGVLHALPAVLLGALCVAAAMERSAAAAMLLALVFVVRATVLRRLQVALTGRSRHAPCASLCAELLQPLHLLHACVDRTIHWRHRHYRVVDNGRFFAVER